MPFKRINVEEARRLIAEANALVVDVRDPASYNAGHIPEARAVDQTNVTTFIQTSDRTRPLIVCCYHGNMSQDAAEYFNRNGFEETYSLDGGYEAWQRSGTAASPAPDPQGFDALPDTARVWIYGAPRRLTPDEAGALGDHMARFMAEWHSHGRPLTPSWQLVHDQFLIIGADEAAFSLSGCSIDSMFRSVEQFGRAHGLGLTNSGGVVFYRDPEGTIHGVERFAFPDLVARGAVDENTIVFDNTVASLADLRNGRWETAMRNTWHMDVFGKSPGS